MSLKLPALAVVALVGAAAGAPSAAGAATPGSVVFSDKGNIWLIGADGSGRRKLTRGGGWSSPSQASNGLIVALRRKQLHRLDQRGRRIGRPVPLLGTNERKSGNVTIQAGPADLEVSPNGRLAAYWIGTLHQTCDPVTLFCDYRLQDNIAVTRTDRFTPFDRFGLTRDYEEPSWVGSQRVLMFNYGFAADIAVDPLGQGDGNLIQLFDDPEGAQLGSGRAPPRAPLMIVLRGPNQVSGRQPSMRLYHLRNDGAAAPVCDFTGGKGGGFASPTISPDGRVLAWVEGDGIHVGRLPAAAALAADPANCGRITDKRITGGREPFWGPKGVR
jgi:hypothetical protein